MSLSKLDQCALLKEFPFVKLSYETIVHKKVYNSDFIVAIPDGKKYFAWFTTYKTQNICVILEITEHNQINQISHINIMTTCFNDQLTYGGVGTIFYGTIFKYDNTKFFCSEDIHYYKGANISQCSYLKKLAVLKQIFESEIKQVSYFDNNLVFGLPIITTSFDDITPIIDLLPYKTKSIQFRFAERKNGNDEIFTMNYSKGQGQSYFNNSNSNTCFKREIVFKIKPDIQNDIYYLYYYDNNSSDNLYEVAYIPDYKTSVMMNKLFRNIKENANLDTLEESDDEAEFENDSLDKFVYLDKTYNMVCSFNTKYKKWEPIRLSQKGEKIINKSELFRLEKNKY